MNKPIDKAEVVVIGAGVSGLSSAWWLAKEGVDVILVEKGVIGWEASGRNGGGHDNRATEPAVEPLARESLRLWPHLEDDLGYPVEYVQGKLSIAMTEQEFETKTRRAYEACQRIGIESELIDGDTVRKHMPIASPEIVGGLYSPWEGKSNPHRTCQAYAWAFRDLGGRIFQDTPAIGFSTSGDRVTAVETPDGFIETDFVVCAAGPQTGILAELAGAFVPVAPGRVEIIITAPVERHWTGGFLGNGLYGRQTIRGNLAYGGGPHEWVDVDLATPKKPNTPLVRNIARRLMEMFPVVEEVPVIRSWSCVVEQTPDNLPIIDVLDQPNNFLVVTMSGHGYGPSPATGKVVSELVTSGESSVNIEGLGLGRFSDIPRDWRDQAGWSPTKLKDSGR